MLTLILRVCGELDPDELFAVTIIIPLFVPTLTDIDDVVEFPVHPEGKVHVYEVSPITGVIL